MAVLIPLILLALLLSSAYISHRWGWRSLAAFVPLAAVSVISTADTGSALTFITPLIMGGMSGFIIRKQIPLKYYVVITSLTVASLFSANYYYMKFAAGTDLLTESKKEMVRIVQSSAIPKEQKEGMMADFDRFMDILRDIIPFSSFMYSMLFAALSYIVAKHFLSRLKGARPGKGLEFFALNEYLVFGLIAGWGMVLLMDRESSEMAYLAALNGALVLSALYFVQALGVLQFFIMKKKLPPYVLAFILILLLVLGKELFVFLSVFLAGLGTLDLWADFRKIHSHGRGTDIDK